MKSRNHEWLVYGCFCNNSGIIWPKIAKSGCAAINEQQNKNKNKIAAENRNLAEILVSLFIEKVASISENDDWIVKSKGRD